METTVLLELKKPPPNILCGGQRYTYQIENAKKLAGIVFFQTSVGLKNPPGTCKVETVKSSVPSISKDIIDPGQLRLRTVPIPRKNYRTN